jgi:hypothetical protein
MHACDQFPRGERRELGRATISVNQLLSLGVQKSLQRILIVFVAFINGLRFFGKSLDRREVFER